MFALAFSQCVFVSVNSLTVSKVCSCEELLCLLLHSVSVFLLV